jgi:hypothetical protein
MHGSLDPVDNKKRDEKCERKRVNVEAPNNVVSKPRPSNLNQKFKQLSIEPDPQPQKPAKEAESSSSSSHSSESSSSESSSSSSSSDESDLQQVTLETLSKFMNPSSIPADSVLHQQNLDETSPFDAFMAKYAGPSTSAAKAEPKPYLDKFKAKAEDEEFFELLNNKNTSVILQKKNFFELNQRSSSEIHKLYNRVCIFNLTELCTQTMQPTVAPLRVGILTPEGIKLRHDFQLD